MGMLDAGTAHMASSLTQHAGQTITYTKRKIQKTFKATRGSTPFEASDTEGIIHRTVSRDYLVAETDWPFDEDPEDGDRITDNGKTYIVRSMTGQPVWRFSDPGENLMRIHTKQQ
jgi:hypothetical protein